MNPADDVAPTDGGDDDEVLPTADDLETDGRSGFPVVRIGRRVTDEEVAEAWDEVPGDSSKQTWVSVPSAAGR